MQNIVFNLKLNSKEFTTSVKGAGDALDGTKEKVKGVGDEAQKTGTKIKDTSKDVQGLGASLNKLGAAAVAAFSVGAIISFGKEVAKVTAEMESLNIRMRGIHDDAQQSNLAMDGLRAMANKYGLELKNLTSSYIQFVSAAKASGTEVEKAEKIFKSMSIAIAGSGVSSEQAKRAFTALTQMMSKNQIMAEELRGQLAEALPMSIGIMAKSLNVTTKELGKMMESGQLIASEVLPKFATEMEKALGKNAQNLAGSLNAQMNRLENSWTDFYTTVGNTGIIEASLSLLSTSIDVLTGSVAMLSGQWAEYQQKVINAERAASLDEFSRKFDAHVQRQIELYGDETVAVEELTKMYEMYTDKFVANSNRIERSKKKFGDAGITEQFIRETQEAEKMSKVLLDHINSLQSKMSVNSGNVQLTEKERKELERQLEVMKKMQAEIEAMRRRAILAEKTDVGKIKQKAEFEVEDLQDNPAFLALSEKEQTAILNEIDNQTNEQVKKLIESKDKGLEKLKAEQAAKELKEINEAELTQFQGLMSNLDNMKALDQISEEAYLSEKLALHKEYGQETTKVDEEIFAFKKQQVQDEKDLEEQKKAMKIDMALQSFELLSALNARYSQGQTEQLNKQLQQGIISQEAYDEQMRKIKRRQAVIDKAGALFQIGLSTAINVAKNPPPSPLGILAIAAGALQAATVIAAPIPYNKGTKRVPFARGAVRGKDSVHAILTPNERVVPESVNMQPGYSALMDLAQDRKISDSEAGFIADLATSGYRANNQSQTASIDYDLLGRSIAKYFPGTDVKIDKNGIAVISERHAKELKRRTSKL